MEAPFDPMVIKHLGDGCSAKHAILFELFFRKDLQQNVENAERFFKKLEDSHLYVVMPLFRKYHKRETALADAYIAKNMGQIITSLDTLRWLWPELLIPDIYKILYVLHNTSNAEINNALRAHFLRYLGLILRYCKPELSAVHFLKQVLAKNIFTDGITAREIREISFFLLEHYFVTEKKNFRDYEKVSGVFLSKITKVKEEPEKKKKLLKKAENVSDNTRSKKHKRGA